MKLISHRGNLIGPNKDRENDPLYVIDALSYGFDVEIDVWFVDGEFFLGHDEPTYEIEEIFLENDRLWCHSKNIESLEKMLLNNKIHCFWHQEDDFTLTSKNIIWTFPTKILKKNSVCVLPERSNYSNEEIKNCFGVCSDYIQNYG
jgi:hypothetical protein